MPTLADAVVVVRYARTGLRKGSALWKNPSWPRCRTLNNNGFCLSGHFYIILPATLFFNPPEIRVPEGSEVTFVATSKDVIHGFLVRAANINAMRKRNRFMCYYSVAERCSFQSGNSKEGTRWDTSHKPH
jgi:hypothetical protein